MFSVWLGFVINKTQLLQKFGEGIKILIVLLEFAFKQCLFILIIYLFIYLFIFYYFFLHHSAFGFILK